MISRFYRLLEQLKKDYAIVISMIVSAVVNVTSSDGRFCSITIVARVARDPSGQKFLIKNTSRDVFEIE